MYKHQHTNHRAAEPLDTQKPFDINVDPITWKTWISSSLKLYGLVGEASHYDILHSTGKQCVVRAYAEDREMFANSFMSYTFSMGDYYGIDTDMACYLRLVRTSTSMVEMVSPNLVEVK